MTAVIVLGPSGLVTARRIRDALPGAVLHGFGPRVAEGAVAFAEVGAHLRALFASGTPIVGVCAAMWNTSRSWVDHPRTTDRRYVPSGKAAGNSTTTSDSVGLITVM